MNRMPHIVAVMLALALLAGCGHRAVYTPDQPYWRDDDMRDIDKPAKRSPSLIWQTVERSSFRQAQQLLDLDRSLRKISGSPRQAWNINSYDEVPSSSWFTNRHYFAPLSAEELRLGRVVTGGPDTTGIWVVSRPKVGGVTAGFWIEDARGDRYIIKFDPPDNPELATSAAVITGRFFHAVGYNVADETITGFHPDRLVIKEGVTWKDHDGVKHPFTREKLDEILAGVNRNADGSIRCMASLLLPDVRGPFSFNGRRDDDPNDWCDHEHRRELRALYVFCSFVNHWDIKDENSMDVYDEEDGRRFVRHFLLDFGSTLGSAGHSAQDPLSGYANKADVRDMLVSFFTLGLKKWQWEDAKPYRYPSVGYFESEIFHPGKWDPIYPIPAFENMTDRDAFWAAKIVMSFRDDDLRALVDAGQLSDPEAREYLLHTLIARRDKIGRHWFAKVNPLDRFEFAQSDVGITIDFEDLSVLYGLEAAGESVYTFQVRYGGKTVIDEQATDRSECRLDAAQVQLMKDVFAPGDEDTPEAHVYEIRLRTQRAGGERSRPVNLRLWYHDDSGRMQLVAIEHED